MSTSHYEAYPTHQHEKAMNLRMTLAAVLTVAAMVGTCAAQADGVCVKGYRDTTPAERATIARVLETVKRALPGPPNNARLCRLCIDHFQNERPHFMCGPVSFEFPVLSRRYIFAPRSLKNFSAPACQGIGELALIWFSTEKLDASL